MRQSVPLRRGGGIRDADTVQLHKTNLRMTNTEFRKLRIPELVKEFSIRCRSGSRCQLSAEGNSRKTNCFLQPTDFAIFSSNPDFTTNGLNGGSRRKCGETWIRQNDGSIDRIAGCDLCRVEAGNAESALTLVTGDTASRNTVGNTVAESGSHDLRKTWMSATFVPVPPM